MKKLAVKGLAGFAVSPNASSPLVAAYVPEGKGAPGFVGIWALEKLSKGESPAPLARRSFFRVRNPQPYRRQVPLSERILCYLALGANF